MTADPDYRLADLIRVYDGALDEEFCDRVIDLFKSDPDGQFRRDRQGPWIEYIITGFSNSAAVSRIICIASASNCFK